MSRLEYPRIGGALPKFQDQARKGRGPRCSVTGCGERAVYLVTVQTNLFRGDDEVAKACGAHCDDAAALLAGLDAEEVAHQLQRTGVAA